MIERHITFTVMPDMTEAFERFFAEDYRPPVTQVPGFITCELLREIEQPDRYRMVFRWAHTEAAVAWRTSDVHQGLQPALNALISSMEIVAYTTVA